MFNAFHHYILCWRSLSLHFSLKPFSLVQEWPSLPAPLVSPSSSFASFSRRSLLLIPIYWLMSLTLISLLSWVSWHPESLIFGYLFSFISIIVGNGRGNEWVLNFSYFGVLLSLFLLKNPFEKSSFFAFSGFYCCRNGGGLWGSMEKGTERKRNWVSMVWDNYELYRQTVLMFYYFGWDGWCVVFFRKTKHVKLLLSFLGNQARALIAKLSFEFRLTVSFLKVAELALFIYLFVLVH